MSDPFDPRAQNALTRPITHVHSVLAYDEDITPYAPVPLHLATASLSFDEDSAPHVVLTGATQVPDQAGLDFLDPRRNVRIAVQAGYVYDDGVHDVHTIANLGLRSRVVRRPQNDLVIVAASDELRVQDYLTLTPATFTPQDDTGDVIARLIGSAVGSTTVVNTLGYDRFVAPGQTVTLDAGEMWPFIQGLADTAGAWVYHDGLSTWHIAPQPLEAGAASATLSVGPRGVIHSSESSVSREAFANLVLVELTQNGTSSQGWAEVRSGPLGTAAIGRRGIKVDLSIFGTTGDPATIASSLVRRAVTRGRQVSLECAAAMYWLRPGQTVTVQLPTGPQERHLIASIVFDMPAGTMNLKTRLPENVTITTGE